MQIRIIDEQGVSYDMTSGATRTLPFQWVGDVDEDIANEMIEAGSAEAVEAKLKGTQEKEDPSDEKPSKKLAGQSDEKLLKEIDDLTDQYRALQVDLTDAQGVADKLKEVLLGFGTDKELLQKFIDDPSGNLFDQLMEEHVAAEPTSIPAGIKPATPTPDAEPAPMDDKQKALLVKYKKFPKQTIIDMLVADKIEYDKTASRDDLASTLAQANSK